MMWSAKQIYPRRFNGERAWSRGGRHLHCHDIAQRDPFLECVVFSPDTDVLLLLVHNFPELTPCTLFWTGRGDQLRNINISKCYKTIGPVQATALLGFHALTG